MSEFTSVTVFTRGLPGYLAELEERGRQMIADAHLQPTVKDAQYLDLCRAGARIFSTCSKRQFMAIVTSVEGRVVGTGYNGSPPGQPHCTDGACPRAQAGTPDGAPYENCVAIHAEQNAIMWSDRTARIGGTLYVNGPPCSGCSKMMAGSGIARVVITNDGSFASWSESKLLLESAGITVVEQVGPS